MMQYPSTVSLASVGLTQRDFLARYVETQRRRLCEPPERFLERVLTQFYYDFPELAPEGLADAQPEGLSGETYSDIPCSPAADLE